MKAFVTFAPEPRTMHIVLGSTHTRRGRRVFVRVLTAWFAIVGLCVQLAAAGACTMGGQGEAGHGPFPICHAQSVADDGQAPGGHPGPSHHDECPYCSVCCHAAIALPQAVGVPTPVPVVAVEPVRTPLRPSKAPRCHAGASPRGPPRAV